jgi:aminoglycoside phosphotransferase family enzyme
MDEKQIKQLQKNLDAELIETHISWLLLNDDFVYKIKKPLKFSFLDFSTFEKRKYYCEEEIRLNRRLAPEIYLDVVGIVEKNSVIQIGNHGTLLDHAVKMGRLPQGNRMDILLKKGKVTHEHIKKIAHRVADFHQKIEVIEGSRYGSWEIVKRQIDDLANHRDTIEQACGLGNKVDLILEKSDGFIEGNKELFAGRQKQSKIRDCHGDLHSANIFIVRNEPIIFDCIEFNKDFRFIDVASEIAFMVMDLEAFGREDLAKLFLEEYLNKTQDSKLKTIISLYLCYRANVRAKIAAIDYSQHATDEAKERMIKYLGLAEKYALSLPGAGS